MFRQLWKLGIVGIVLAALITGGCTSKPSVDNKQPDHTGMGIINMEKVIIAHPRYAEFQAAQKKFENINLQIQNMRVSQQANSSNITAPNAGSGIDKQLEQEYNARMTEKHRELNKQFAAVVEANEKKISAEMAEYRRQLEQEYGLPIFNLQLKIKTVQLTKEQMAEVQKQIQQLEQARSKKLQAKQQELSAKLNELLKPQQQIIEEELKKFSEQLNSDLTAKRSAALANVEENRAKLQVQMGNAPGDLAKQATELQTKGKQIHDAIVADITQQISKIAAEKGLHTVLTNISVNVTALDITDDVIKLIKK